MTGDHLAGALIEAAVVGAPLPRPGVIVYRKGRSVPTMIALTFLCYPLALIRALVMERDAAVLEARRRPSATR